jgi:hypothetical protein
MAENVRRNWKDEARRERRINTAVGVGLGIVATWGAIDHFTLWNRAESRVAEIIAAEGTPGLKSLLDDYYSSPGDTSARAHALVEKIAPSPRLKLNPDQKLVLEASLMAYSDYAYEWPFRRFDRGLSGDHGEVSLARWVGLNPDWEAKGVSSDAAGAIKNRVGSVISKSWKLRHELEQEKKAKKDKIGQQGKPNAGPERLSPNDLLKQKEAVEKAQAEQRQQRLMQTNQQRTLQQRKIPGR